MERTHAGALTGPLREYYDAKALELDELAVTYDSPLASKRAFYGARFEAVMVALDARAGERVLDVGCGAGRYARALVELGAEVTATDLAPNYVAQAEAHAGGGTFVVADAQALPFADGVFDRVLLTEVLEHLPDPARALGEAHRVLRPGGVLAASTPSRFSPLNVAYGLKRHVRGYRVNEHLHELTPGRFRRLLEARFRVEELGFANFLFPYPLDLLYQRLDEPGVTRLPALERRLARTPALRRLGWTMVARAVKP